MELIEDTGMGKPHVVLLGAGASVQAFPDGEKNGFKLPLMHNFMEVVGLTELFEELETDCTSGEFEELFSCLYYEQNYLQLEKLEEHIYQYFDKLELPEHPTLYDHLVLSLREKDLIATFNWDPFLMQALIRNSDIAPLPHVVFLHGNVAVGHCVDDKKMGSRGDICSVCRRPFAPTRLLFPITKERYYQEDPFSKAQWNKLHRFLEHAYLFTIFGFGAPDSDTAAVELMKEGWGNIYERNHEQVEVIDIKDEFELRKKMGYVHRYTSL